MAACSRQRGQSPWGDPGGSSLLQIGQRPRSMQSARRDTDRERVTRNETITATPSPIPKIAIVAHTKLAIVSQFGVRITSCMAHPHWCGLHIHTAKPAEGYTRLAYPPRL